MTIVGAKKQEAKILELSEIGSSVFPQISLLSFKGMFRLAIKDALTQTGYGDYSELAAEPAALRRSFFNQMLEKLKQRLINQGIEEKDAAALTARLRKENEKFVST